MARTKQTARKISASSQKQDHKPGENNDSQPKYYKSTNKDLLESQKPKLMARQIDCMQGTFEERRERYELLKYVPLEHIPTWDQMALANESPAEPKASQKVNFSIENKKLQQMSKQTISKEENNTNRESSIKKYLPTNDNSYPKAGDSKSANMMALPSVSESLHNFDATLNRIISVHMADLAMLEVDAIVVSSDAFLGRKEMADSVFKSAGLDLEKELNVMREHGRVPRLAGQCVIAAGYEIPTRYVIFASIPTVMDDLVERHLTSCYKNALQLVPQYNIKSIAFPCLGTGGYSLPKQKCCKIALTAVREWLEEQQDLITVERIIFCCFKKDDLDLYCTEMHQYFPIFDNGVKGLDMIKFLGEKCENLRGFILNHLRESAILNNCSGLTFVGVGNYLTDLMFWLMLRFSGNDGWKSVTAINCTGCISLTDCSLNCIAKVFPNIELAEFTGCIGLTEPGIQRFLLSLKLTIKEANFGGIPGVRTSLQNINPESKRSRRWKKKKTKEGIDKQLPTVLKIILVKIKSNSNGLKLDALKALKNDCKIIEIEPTLLPMIDMRNSVIIIDDISVESTIFSMILAEVFRLADGAPIIFCSSGAHQKVEQLKKRVAEPEFNQAKPSLLNLPECLNLSNAFRISHCLQNNPVYYLPVKKIQDPNKSDWEAIFNIALKTEFSRFQSESTSDESIGNMPALFQVDENMNLSNRKTQIDNILEAIQNGSLYKFGGWISKSLEPMKAIMDQRKINLNNPSELAAVPWLPDVNNVIFLNDACGCLQTDYGLSPIKALSLMDSLIDEYCLFIPIPIPWMNSFNNIPVLLSLDNLDEMIDVQYERLGLGVSFVLNNMLPLGAMASLMKCVGRFASIDALSQTGIICTVACFTVFVSCAKPAGNKDQSSLDLRIISKTGLNDMRVPKPNIDKWRKTRSQIFTLMISVVNECLIRECVPFERIETDCSNCGQPHKVLSLSKQKIISIEQCLETDHFDEYPFGIIPPISNCSHNMEPVGQVETRCYLCQCEMDLEIDSVCQGLCSLWCVDCNVCINCIQQIQVCNKLLEFGTGFEKREKCPLCSLMFPYKESLQFLCFRLNEGHLELHQQAYIEIFRNMDIFEGRINGKRICSVSKTEDLEVTVILAKSGHGFVWNLASSLNIPHILTVGKGMLLEAKDPQTDEFKLATVEDFTDDGQIIVTKFVKGELLFEYSCELHDPRLRHVDSSAHTISDSELLQHYYLEAPFSWEQYIKNVSAYALPFDFFTKSQTFGNHDMIFERALPDINFMQNWERISLIKEGMKLEAKDRSTGQVRHAYIKQIKSNTQLRIAMDDLNNGAYTCNFNSKDLHPLGYSLFIDHKFNRKTNIDVDQFCTEHLDELDASPVPYEFFTQDQREDYQKAKFFDAFAENQRGEFFDELREANSMIYWADRYRTLMPAQQNSTVILLPVEQKSSWLRQEKWDDWTFDKQKLHWLCFHSDMHDELMNEQDVRTMTLLPLRFTGHHLFGWEFTLTAKNVTNLLEQLKTKSLPPKATFYDVLNILGPSIIMGLRAVINFKLTATFHHERTQTSLSQDLSNNERAKMLETLYRTTCLNYYALSILINEKELNSNAEINDVLYDQFSQIAQATLGSQNPGSGVKSTAIYCDVHKNSITDDEQNKLHWNEDSITLKRCISLRDSKVSQLDWNYVTQKVPVSRLPHLTSVIYKPKRFDEEHKIELMDNLVSNARLQHLSYRGCFLTNISMSLTATSIFTMTVLDLDSNPFKQMPPIICKMFNLKMLLLRKCALTAIPEAISNLKRLRVLNLGGNLIESVPEGLKQLKSLRELDLSGVPLLGTAAQDANDEIRITFTWFKRHLGSYNLLLGKSDESIEEEFNKVGVLNFRQNIVFDERVQLVDQFLLDNAPRLNFLPTRVMNLQRISSLDLSHCEMAEIPDDIRGLLNLKVLKLDCCTKLVRISEYIGGLPIHTLSLRGCAQLKTPPLEIVARGTVSVLNYMKRLLSGFTECKRTKLMLVGLGGAGKTSLVRALLSGEYRSSGTTAEEITDGIDIAEWTVRLNVGGEDSSINYSVWDFAGQAVYYNTHQFFLSNRAVYILVWNARLGYEHSGLNFWLSSITCHAPKAPIFVVGSHADQVFRADLPQAELKRAFGQIVDFHFISCLNGDGVETLAQALFSSTLQQNYMGERIPSIWLNLERELIEKRKSAQVMSYEEVETRALKKGLLDSTEIRESLTLLHELGSIQYFPNEFLKSRIVINPQWLVNVMACLISVKQSVIKDGKFERSSLFLIWEEYPAELHDWLLYLTEEFDLTYSLPSENLNVVPCLLPEDEPENAKSTLKRDIAGDGSVKMTYNFEYLPAGLFNRLQTRLSQYSESATVWKKGSLLHKNCHTALLKQFGSQIDIEVAGPKPENILFLVHEVLDSLVHEFFKGIRFDVFVPCCDCTKAGSADPHMFSAKQIKKAEISRAPFLQCTQNFHIVALDALKELLPPITIADFEQHLMLMSQDLGRLSSNVKPKVLFVTLSKDMEPKCDLPIPPEKVLTRLRQNNNLNVKLMDMSKLEMQEIARDISSCASIITCVTENSCIHQHFSNIISYCKQSTHKSVIPLIFASGEQWKKSGIGLQVTSEVYVDFRKPERFDTRMKELCNRIETKSIKESALKVNSSTKHYPVFLSYCWANSNQAVKLGTKSIEGAIGPVDPREVEQNLSQNGLSVWIDVKCAREGILFEEISLALRDAQLFVACVSDQYIVSRNCMLEFRFAVGVLKLPVILCSVGIGHEWQISEIGMLALNAPRVDCQIKNKNELERLVQLVKDIVHRESDVIEPKSLPDSSTTDQSAFEELCELSQRKFLNQITRISGALRATDALYSTPYPRLFYLDLLDPPDDSPTNPDYLLYFPTLRFNNLKIQLLCEISDGNSWHSAGKPFVLSSYSELPPAQFLIKSASFMAAIYPILQAIAVNDATMQINFMKLQHYSKYLNQIKHMSQDQSLEVSYDFLSKVVRSLDNDSLRGGMLRSSLHDRRILWLCSKHQTLARATIQNDTIDAEDIGIDFGDRPSSSTVPKKATAIFHPQSVDSFETEEIQAVPQVERKPSPIADLTSRPNSRPNSSLNKLRSKLCLIQ